MTTDISTRPDIKAEELVSAMGEVTLNGSGKNGHEALDLAETVRGLYILAVEDWRTNVKLGRGFQPSCPGSELQSLQSFKFRTSS